MNERCTTFLLRLEAEPVADGIRALRAALKLLLRRFQLRVVEAREEPAEREERVS